MNGFISRLLLGCLLSLPWQADVAADRPGFAGAAAGILVLRNGNVLAGRVVRLQEH